MKKFCFTAACLLVLLPSAVRAQEIPYALPCTSIGVKVEIRQESFFAGPYAEFAKKLLNMSARSHDEITCTVTRAELIPRTEADPDRWYSTDTEAASLLSFCSQGLISLGSKTAGENTGWRFLPALGADFSSKGLTHPEKETTRIEYRQIQTDTAVVTVPVEHKVLVEKTLEDKAMDAADMILAIRKDRLNIATGNTDASYSGNAMESALRELDRQEQEYLALFRGYTVVRTFSREFEVIPSADVKNHRYLVFRLTEDGPVEGGVKGTPYYLELEPQMPSVPEEGSDRRKARTFVRYRIPAVCTVSLSKDGVPLLKTRIPVYQLGKESTLYLNK